MGTFPGSPNNTKATLGCGEHIIPDVKEKVFGVCIETKLSLHFPPIGIHFQHSPSSNTFVRTHIPGTSKYCAPRGWELIVYTTTHVSNFSLIFPNQMYKYVCHIFALLPTFHFVRALFGKTPSTRTREARPDTLVEVSARSVHSGARGGRSKFFFPGGSG